LALRGGNVHGDPKQCRKRNIPKSATNAAGSEMTLLSKCGMNQKRAFPAAELLDLQINHRERGLCPKNIQAFQGRTTRPS
jgi:hypothetical protein